MGWAELRGRRPEQQDTLSVVQNFRFSPSPLGIYESGLTKCTSGAARTNILPLYLTVTVENDPLKSLHRVFIDF